MRVTIIKAVLGWDESACSSLSEARVQEELRRIGVDVIITDASSNECDPPYGSVHNALVSEIDSASEPVTRNDLPAAARRPTVEVREMGGGWRLFIGDYGVATWPSQAAAEDPEAYAREVARCVRVALGIDK